MFLKAKGFPAHRRGGVFFAVPYGKQKSIRSVSVYFSTGKMRFPEGACDEYDFAGSHF